MAYLSKLIEVEILNNVAYGENLFVKKLSWIFINYVQNLQRLIQVDVTAPFKISSYVLPFLFSSNKLFLASEWVVANKFKSFNADDTFLAFSAGR